MNTIRKISFLFFALVLAVSCVQKQQVVNKVSKPDNGYRLWLRYNKIKNSTIRDAYLQHLSLAIVPGTSKTMQAIRSELKRGLDGLLGELVPIEKKLKSGNGLYVGTPRTSGLIAGLGLKARLDSLGDEGFIILHKKVNGRRFIIIASEGKIGALYGTFHFLRLLQTNQSISDININDKPLIHYRMLDHWDNLNGSIERGYAGKSLWKWNQLPDTLDSRYTDYARANASIGINGVVLNNVNANPEILRTSYLKKVAALANVFRPYGIHVFISANFASPLKPNPDPHFKKWGGVGNLTTADPLNPKVRKWWVKKVDEIYHYIPDFGGFLVKSNSEGMPGPASYGRTQAQGANMLASALAPHHGIVLWRTFLHEVRIDTDRAKRDYKVFKPLDGKFDKNVLLQTKYGPVDFQPREPVQPLFGSMPHTPMVLSFEITQEYLGHATTLTYLAPMWKRILDFDTYSNGKGSTVASVIVGKLSGRTNMTGIAGVANTGSDRNWTGNLMAQANWYAYGRLAWNPHLSARKIADEWIKMTWSNQPDVVDAIRSIMMESYRATVNFMTPMGLTFLVGHNHYLPDPRYDEQNIDTRMWEVNHKGLGYNRTRSGSDAVDEYHEPVSSEYNRISSTPEGLLLYFHFIPWKYKLKTGRTMWRQLCYDYNEGVRQVKHMRNQWAALKGKVDSSRFQSVQNLLNNEIPYAQKWRNGSLAYFHRYSQLPISNK